MLKYRLPVTLPVTLYVSCSMETTICSNSEHCDGCPGAPYNIVQAEPEVETKPAIAPLALVVPMHSGHLLPQ